jgi:hypothetical protein
MYQFASAFNRLFNARLGNSHQVSFLLSDVVIKVQAHEHCQNRTVNQ